MIRYLVRRHSPLLNAIPDLRGMDKDDIGRLGEKMAARYLYAHGGKVLYRNYRAPIGGEIDIVLRHGKILAFVEVKTRTSDAFGRAADAVNFHKQELISRGAQSWLRLLGYPNIPWRCDIVEVYLKPKTVPEINWLQSAFTISDLHQPRPRQWTRRR